MKVSFLAPLLTEDTKWVRIHGGSFPGEHAKVEHSLEHKISLRHFSFLLGIQKLLMLGQQTWDYKKEKQTWSLMAPQSDGKSRHCLCLDF